MSRVGGRPRAQGGSVLALLSLLTACANHGLAFWGNARVEVTRPTPQARSNLPVTVEWTGPAGAYAVFIDRSPMPPGKDVRWLARDDDACRKAPGCPDATWLAARGVYVTTSKSVVVSTISTTTAGRHRSDHAHRAVIVPLDAGGGRSGEQAYSRTFFVLDGR
ncbi:MAG: hypothetical protein ACYDAD_01580 [Acidimicrobiales bacterium]